MTDLTTMDRDELLQYIEQLEMKVETLSAQLDLLSADAEDFRLPETMELKLNLSEQTTDSLAEAAALFGGDSQPEEEEPVVEPAPVEDGVVTLDPVTAEDYIPVGTVKKPIVKVKVKRK